MVEGVSDVVRPWKLGTSLEFSSQNTQKNTMPIMRQLVPNYMQQQQQQSMQEQHKKMEMQVNDPFEWLMLQHRRLTDLYSGLLQQNMTEKNRDIFRKSCENFLRELLANSLMKQLLCYPLVKYLRNTRNERVGYYGLMRQCYCAQTLLQERIRSVMNIQAKWPWYFQSIQELFNGIRDHWELLEECYLYPALRRRVSVTKQKMLLEMMRRCMTRVPTNVQDLLSKDRKMDWIVSQSDLEKLNLSLGHVCIEESPEKIDPVRHIIDIRSTMKTRFQ